MPSAFLTLNIIFLLYILCCSISIFIPLNLQFLKTVTESAQSLSYHSSSLSWQHFGWCCWTMNILMLLSFLLYHPNARSTHTRSQNCHLESGFTFLVGHFYWSIMACNSFIGYEVLLLHFPPSLVYIICAVVSWKKDSVSLVLF